MEVEITPEPSPDERRALLASVESLSAAPGPPAVYRSGWRERGIVENTQADDGYETVARPRSSPGATRA
jgi:hypothetical protein